MANKLYINGKDISNDVENIKDFTIVLGLNENNTVGRALSESITVNGETYEYFKNIYFDNCDSYDEVVEVLFKSDVCNGITLNLKTTMEGMGFFPDEQKISLLLKSITEDDRAFARLDSDYWFDNDFAQSREIPIVYYADQPNWIQWAIIILTAQIRVMLNIIDEFIKAVCKVVTLGFGDCNVNLSGAVFSALDTWLTGLGRWGTAPLFRDIISFQCISAGISFSSSILNDPTSLYYNLVMFHLERGIKGTYKDTSNEERERILMENAPLYTTIEILDNLKNVFEDYDYRIIEGTLYFEDKGFFLDLTNVRLFHIKDKCIDNVEYRYNIDELVAWGEFRFQNDSFDTEGNKVMSFYKTKLDFNIPYSPAQKGKLSRSIPFSPARFMFDMLSYELDGFLDWELNIDEFRDGTEAEILKPFFENEGLIRTNDLILAGNTLITPKLLVLENNFNYSDARAIKKPYKKRKGKQFWLYNWPLLYKDVPDKIIGGEFVEGIEGELTRFAEKANPRLQKQKIFIDSITIDCDCTSINAVVNQFQQIYLDTAMGKGVPTDAKIQFKETKITISFSKIRIKCN